MPRMALDGIRVADLSHAWAGPFVTNLLGYNGAEIIKIESIQRFDLWRLWGQIRPEEEGGYNRGSIFNGVNVNKKSLTLNLTKPRGKKIFKKLIRICDVVVENFSARVMANFGLEYPVLKEINPQVIMLSMPAFGGTGPWKNYVGFAAPVEEVSGVSYLCGYPDSGPMVTGVGDGISDALAGLYGTLAVMTALNFRERTGKGQHIDLSQSEALSSLVGEAFVEYSMTGKNPERRGNRHRYAAPYGCYPCKGEDKWVSIAVFSDEQWENFCKALGHLPWSRDEKFSTPKNRWKNQNELDRFIQEWTIGLGHYEAMRILQEAGVPAGAVLDPREMLYERNWSERGFYEVMNHREVGPHPYPGMPWKFSKTPGSIRLPAPCLGEHNEYVLGELLGLSKEEIKILEEEKIIGTRPVE